MTTGTHQFLPFEDDRWLLDTAVWRGVTNGLPALRWAPILDVQSPLVAPLLAALAAHGVAARAEPLTAPRRPRRASGQPPWRIWVDAIAHARSEDILRVELSTQPGVSAE